MMKLFDSEMMFFGLDLEEITSYGQKHFWEMNNRLCKVSTHKQNDRLQEILFPAVAYKVVSSRSHHFSYRENVNILSTLITLHSYAAGQSNTNTSENTSKVYCLPVLNSNNLYQNDTTLQGMI